MNLRYHAPPTYFIHIPKTGGVAFSKLLASAYRHQECLHLEPVGLAGRTVDQVQHYRHYHSWHQDRGMYELIGRKDLLCLTLLRDPVERVVSSIHYMQHTLTNQPHRLTPALFELYSPLQYATMSECLNHRNFRPVAEDLQTWILGMKSDYSYFFGGDKIQEVSRPFDNPYLPLSEIRDPKLVLADAYAWLTEMPLVGITERYEETVLLTCDLLGIAPPRQVPQANINPQRPNFAMRYRPQLDPAIIAQIEEMNRHDIELYAYACELFAQHWSRYKARPRRTYSLVPRLKRTRAQARRILRPAKQFIKQSLRGKRDEMAPQ